MFLAAALNNLRSFDLCSIEYNPSAHRFFTTHLSYGFFSTISRTTRSSPTSVTLIDNIFSNDLSKVIGERMITLTSRMITSLITYQFLSHWTYIVIYLSNQIKKNRAEKKLILDCKRKDDFKINLRNNLACIVTEQSPEVMAEKNHRNIPYRNNSIFAL